VSGGGGGLVAIGVGNVLLGDDAAGVRVIEHLRILARDDPAALPRDTCLVDGGTLGLDLLGTVREARGAVLVDAVRMGKAPGAVRVLDADAAIAAGSTPDGATASALSELIAAARLVGWLPDEVRVVGIEIADIGPGIGLSPLVASAIPRAARAVRDELRRMDDRLATGNGAGRAIRSRAGATA
jgi:hydrogenase maturation protease